MLTKKDFKAVAKNIKNMGWKPPHQKRIINDLADYFATQNPRFDRSRFMRACGLTE